MPGDVSVTDFTQLAGQCLTGESTCHRDLVKILVLPKSVRKYWCSKHMLTRFNCELATDIKPSFHRKR